MITGIVSIDLRNVEPDRARLRFACLSQLPGGVRVEIEVGALAANPAAARAIAEQENRLHFEIKGEPYAVQAWLNLIRNPDVLVWH